MRNTSVVFVYVEICKDNTLYVYYIIYIVCGMYRIVWLAGWLLMLLLCLLCML